MNNYFRKQLLKKYSSLQKQVLIKLKQFIYVPELRPPNFKPVKGYPGIYRYKITDNFRAFCTFNEKGQYYCFFDFGPHDKYDELNYRTAFQDKNLFDLDEFRQDSELPYKLQERDLRDITPYLEKTSDGLLSDKFFNSEIDWYLLLSPEQNTIVDYFGGHSIFVQGAAGTGKSTSVIYRALRIIQNRIFTKVYVITYNQNLNKVFEYYLDNLSQSEGIEGIYAVTFGEFMKAIANYLSCESVKSFLTKRESMYLIKNILQQKSIEARPNEIFEIIYTLKTKFEKYDHNKKARKPEDFDKFIFEYETNHKLPLDAQQLFTIFQEYTNQLEKNRYQSKPYLDQADFAWKLYDALYSNQIKMKPFAILIDEVQDFRRLECEIIWLVKNAMELALSRWGDNRLSFFGDENQQITITDFSWDDLIRLEMPYLPKDSNRYRKKVIQNHRNTIEIARIDQFLYDLSKNREEINDWVEPFVHGPKPFLFIGENMDDWLDWLRKLIEKYKPPYHLGIISEDPSVMEYFDNHWGEEKRAFVAPAEECKGLEFEDLIIIRLFSSYKTTYGKGKTIPKKYRDLWHMSVSRARTNLMVFLTKTDLYNLKKYILPDECEVFLSCFKIINQRQDWDKHGKQFIAQCEYDLPGFSRILLDLSLADNLWERFLNEQKDDLKFLALKRYDQQNAFDKAKDLLQEYWELHNSSKPNWECLIDIAHFHFRLQNFSSCKKNLKLFLQKTNNEDLENSFERLIIYLNEHSLFVDTKVGLIECLLDESSQGIELAYNLLYQNKFPELHLQAMTLILKRIQFKLNHWEKIIGVA